MSWLVDRDGNTEKLRNEFRSRLKSGPVMVLPGVFDGLSALLAKRVGFADGLYLSGAALTASQGLPDVGLINSSDVWARATEVVRASRLPVLVDIDTGFGGVLNATRAVRELDQAGVVAVQIEDQALPKKCGHLNGKQVISADDMCAKIRAIRLAVPDLVIVARTDARAVEGMASALERARRYRDAGADALFIEALDSLEEFKEASRAVPAPLLANMTEFGRTPYLSVSQFAELGYRIVIFPVTALRVAAFAMEQLYRTLLKDGTQQSWLDRMQTRQDLYALLDYEQYEALDTEIARTVLPEAPGS